MAVMFDPLQMLMDSFDRAKMDRKEALKAQVFQPDVPELLFEPPEMSKGKKTAASVFSTIADALAARAATYGAPVRPGFNEALHQRIREGMEARAKNRRAELGAKTEAERARAERDLGKIDVAEGRAHEAGLKRMELDAKAAERAAKAAQEEAEKEEKQAQKDADALWDLRVDAAKSGAVVGPDATKDELLAAVSKANQPKPPKPDKPEKPDMQAISFGNSAAIGMLKGVPANPETGTPAIPPIEERLRAGESPDEILREFEMTLDKAAVTGIERAEVMKTFDKWVGSAIRRFRAAREQYEKNADLTDIKPEKKPTKKTLSQVFRMGP